MTPERLTALAERLESEWRRRTPPQSIYDALPESRVTFSDLADWYAKTYHEPLHALARRDLAAVLRPVFKRLRKEFPKERWGK